MIAKTFWTENFKKVSVLNNLFSNFGSLMDIMQFKISSRLLQLYKIGVLRKDSPNKFGWSDAKVLRHLDYNRGRVAYISLLKTL